MLTPQERSGTRLGRDHLHGYRADVGEAYAVLEDKEGAVASKVPERTGWRLEGSTREHRRTKRAATRPRLAGGLDAHHARFGAGLIGEGPGWLLGGGLDADSSASLGRLGHDDARPPCLGEHEREE